MDAYRRWIGENRDCIRKDYFEFLAFQSISSELQYAKQVRACAKWVVLYLQSCGFGAELVETSGHPVVWGEDLSAGSDRPMLLIYGHYDVQPVDPLELWKSPPFEATERDGKVFARGAVDDKGQIFYAMCAMKMLRSLHGGLPINVKFCIEGEEESGSEGLADALPRMQKRLRADSLLVVDYDSYDEKTPAINLGARGIMTLSVSLTGSNGDLHSGIYGGIAYNPNRAMAELLASLYDCEGRVAVDGFYDGVREPTAEEIRSFGRDEDILRYAKEAGIEAFGGEKGRSLSEANLLRPVLEINGIAGGYAGSGFKTVIPAKTVAKLSCRLVPGQDPDDVGHKIARFLKGRCPRGMKIDVDLNRGAAAYRANLSSRLAQAIGLASEEVMRRPCKRVLSGASVPIVGALARAAGADIVGMGYGLVTDLIHAPNEHFDFPRLERGLLTVARGLELL